MKLDLSFVRKACPGDIVSKISKMINLLNPILMDKLGNKVNSNQTRMDNSNSIHMDNRVNSKVNLKPISMDKLNA